MRLRPGHVLVRTGVPAPMCAVAKQHDLLTGAEWQHAESIGRSRSRQEFTAARALLRASLADVTGEEPKALRLERREGGGPRAWDGRGEELAVSVSHTRGLVACAVGRLGATGAVGVDAEPRDRPVAALALAQRYFHPDESDAVRALPESARGAQFLALWTAKEALGKALGKGVSAVLAGPPFRVAGEAVEGGAAGFDYELHALPSGHWLAVASRGAEAVSIEPFRSGESGEPGAAPEDAAG